MDIVDITLAIPQLHFFSTLLVVSTIQPLLMHLNAVNLKTITENIVYISKHNFKDRGLLGCRVIEHEALHIQSVSSLQFFD